MSVPTQPSSRVWAKVEHCLNRAPWLIQEQFRILKQNLTTYGGNPDLQLGMLMNQDAPMGLRSANFSGEVSEICRLHGVYVRKGDQQRPDQDPESPDPIVPDLPVYFQLTRTQNNNGDTTGGKAFLSLPLIGVGASAAVIFGSGLDLAGIDVGASTVPTGDQTVPVPQEHGLWGFYLVSYTVAYLYESDYETPMIVRA